MTSVYSFQFKYDVIVDLYSNYASYLVYFFSGTNMACCFNGIAKHLKEISNPNLSEVTTAIINTAIMSARGNSGTILSCFFNAINKAVRGRARLTMPELVDMIKEVGMREEFFMFTHHFLQ